ncbi:MAG: hypothetical protein IJU91_01140, partial [Selenomonadaceae bacterium]|nr:hypothetical protein [Selenomonadaceae bacterium]
FMAALGFNLSNIFNSIGARGLASVVSNSPALMETATDWEIGGGSESGTRASVSYNQLVGALNIAGSIFTNQYSASTYYNGGYTNGDVSVYRSNYSSINSTSTLSQSTVYNVGNRNGYLNGYNVNTDTLNFVNADIQSWTRENDYVNFNMGNDTTFVAQTNSSTDDIFRYTTDGVNTYYAKIGFTSQDNSFAYQDGVLFIGSNDHVDTLNVSTYDRNIDLRGGQYISIDNINASNANSTYYARQLIGNAGNNEIRAGAGSNELWGGAGNDVLYGGGGAQDTYLYGVNEGSDVIYNSVSTDKVDLYNVSLEQISGYGYENNNLILNMAGGESLTVVGQDGASNFVLADRSAYNYNRQTNTWTQTAPASV